jgi:hypothetical protein
MNTVTKVTSGNTNADKKITFGNRSCSTYSTYSTYTPPTTNSYQDERKPGEYINYLPPKRVEYVEPLLYAPYSKKYMFSTQKKQ